jgi:hypothetical protein
MGGVEKIFFHTAVATDRRRRMWRWSLEKVVTTIQYTAVAVYKLTSGRIQSGPTIGITKPIDGVRRHRRRQQESILVLGITVRWATTGERISAPAADVASRAGQMAAAGGQLVRVHREVKVSGGGGSGGAVFGVEKPRGELLVKKVFFQLKKKDELVNIYVQYRNVGDYYIYIYCIYSYIYARMYTYIYMYIFILYMYIYIYIRYIYSHRSDIDLWDAETDIR